MEIEPTPYDLDLAHAIENTIHAYKLADGLITPPGMARDPKVIVETPDGPLAVTGVIMEDGVIKIITLE